jgi:hypothetical protein
MVFITEREFVLCEVCDDNLNATMAFKQYDKSVDAGTIPIIVKSSAFQTFLLEDPFCLRKITTDPHTLAHFNTGCPNDRYPKLKI